MLAAADVMMRDALVLVGRNFVPVTLEMTGRVRCDRNRHVPVCGVRDPARPEQKDERQSAEQMDPPIH